MRISVAGRPAPNADRATALGSTAPPQRIDVGIDRLVLRGFADGQGAAIAMQLRSELARLLADPSVATALLQSRHLPVLRLGAPSREASASRASIGARAAASIIEGLKQ